MFEGLIHVEESGKTWWR